MHVIIDPSKSAVPAMSTCYALLHAILSWIANTVDECSSGWKNKRHPYVWPGIGCELGSQACSQHEAARDGDILPNNCTRIKHAMQCKRQKHNGCVRSLRCDKQTITRTCRWSPVANPKVRLHAGTKHSAHHTQHAVLTPVRLRNHTQPKPTCSHTENLMNKLT